MEAVLFFIAAIGALGGAIGVVAMRNPFYSVLALLVHLFSLAVLFLLLDRGLRRRRPGGRLRRRGDGPLRLRRRLRGRRRRVGLGADPRPALSRRPLLGIALFVELSIAVLSSALLALDTDGPDGRRRLRQPGRDRPLLLEDFLVPFEVSSILLLLAAVGAIVLAGEAATIAGAGRVNIELVHRPLARSCSQPAPSAS